MLDAARSGLDAVRSIGVRGRTIAAIRSKLQALSPQTPTDAATRH